MLQSAEHVGFGRMMLDIEKLLSNFLQIGGQQPIEFRLATSQDVVLTPPYIRVRAHQKCGIDCRRNSYLGPQVRNNNGFSWNESNSNRSKPMYADSYAGQLLTSIQIDHKPFVHADTSQVPGCL